MGALVLVAGMSPASAAAGSVKVDNAPGTPSNHNNPHQLCGIQVQFSDFGSDTHTATIAFSGQGGSGTTTAGVLPGSGLLTFTFSDSSTSIYYIDTSGLVPTNANQGYHIDVDTTVDNDAKQKVIFVQSCIAPTAAVVKTNNADGDGSYSASESALNAGADVPFRLTITNTSDYTVDVTSVTDSVDGGAGTTVTCTPALVLDSDETGYCYFTMPSYSPADGVTKNDVATVNLVKDDSEGPSSSVQSTQSSVTTHLPAVTKANNANGDEAYSINETATTVGAAVPFRLHITNTSPYAVNVTSVTDFVGADVEGTPVTCSPALGTLAVGASADCLFTMPGYSPADGVTKSDTAKVVLTKAAAQLPSLRRVAALAVALPSVTVTSNVSTVTTHVPVIIPNNPGAPDLKIVKTGPASAVKPGDSVPYTLVVTNDGTAGASGVQVADTLPAGLTFVSASGTGFTCGTGPNVLCTLSGTLAVGSSATVNVVTTLAPTYASSTVVNVAVVTPTDATPADNTSTATTAVTLPQDLGLTKTGPASTTRGSELVYTITVTNNLGAPATGFTVTDVLPLGLSYSSASGTGYVCSQAAGTITCVYGGSLAVGASAPITVRALLLETFTALAVANTAVLDPGRPDSVPGNNTSTATTTVVQPPISGGGGGGAEAPSPSPSPAAGGGGAPTGLPFTGSQTEQLLSTALGLLLLGLAVAFVARRRRTGIE